MKGAIYHWLVWWGRRADFYEKLPFSKSKNKLKLGFSRAKVF
jgi:hypothetical protein